MADYGIKKYCLGTAVLRRAMLVGFTLEKGGKLRKERSDAQKAYVLLPGIDSAVSGCEWGRIAMHSRLGTESVLRVRAMALDEDRIIRGDGTVLVDDFLLSPDVPAEEKLRLFTMANAVEQEGENILLDRQTGRYLWLWLEISGSEEALIENVSVYVPGDNFFRTVPEVYRTDNDFLRRYLSIFSTMFRDFQEEIDAIPSLLDVDTAPDKLLPLFASWLGLEIDDSLFSPEELRVLLKAAPSLLARKGSRRAVEEAVKLFVKAPVYIAERNLIADAQVRSAQLYGDSPFDFTVMIGCHTDKKLKKRLQFLIDQFSPIRSRCRIVFLEDCGGLDAFTYLDLNGTVYETSVGALDDAQAFTGLTYLE